MKKNKGKKKEKFFRKPKPKVHCKDCKMFVDVDDIEFVDIEEDIQGVDVMTYVCPHCKKQQKSKVFG